jgi:hypothetical protein
MTNPIVSPMLMCVAGVALMMSACNRVDPSPPVKATPDGPATFQLPTATEVFNLRSKCASLADVIAEENPHGMALAHEVASHYDEKTNRCYVELSVHMADLARYEEQRARYVYDGQTKEMLAWARSENGKKTGMVFIPGGVRQQDPYQSASDTIDALMHDDRGRRAQ